MANPTPKAPTKTAPQQPSEGTQEAANVVQATQVAVQASSGSTAVALPADMLAEFEAEAKDAADAERPSVSKISLRSGQMNIGGNPLPGNKVRAVLLAGVYWNKFYQGKYNPNVIVNPTCFAVAVTPEEADDMEPHENVDNPVHENCASCPNMDWGSAGEGSRGKACKESRRLVMIPEDALASPEAVMKAEISIIDVPVTSVRNYGNFVNILSASVKRPMYAVITELSVVPDPKSQFKLQFQPVQLINDAAVLQAVRSRVDEAKRAGSIPYDEQYLQGDTTDKNVRNTSPVVPTGKFSRS
jgi:hypothetical protein